MTKNLLENVYEKSGEAAVTALNVAPKNRAIAKSAFGNFTLDLALAAICAGALYISSKAIATFTDKKEEKAHDSQSPAAAPPADAAPAARDEKQQETTPGFTSKLSPRQENYVAALANSKETMPLSPGR